MTLSEEEADLAYADWVDCWQCARRGGWNSCMEDCCPAAGGEDMCADPVCWRDCDICDGEGGWEPTAAASQGDDDERV